VNPPFAGDWSPESGRAAGLLIAERPDITAVFAANDQMALGLMHALHERGLNVPGDISVVGFDDTPESAYFWPSLTTVRQHFDEVGRGALRSLVATIEGQPAPVPRLVPVNLVLRESTAPRRA
jgi:DNA-binding LacI/PurR family transcriptional regulator